MSNKLPQSLDELSRLLPTQYVIPNKIPQVYQSYRRSKITTYQAHNLIQAATAFMTLVIRHASSNTPITEQYSLWLQHELNCFHNQLKHNRYPETIRMTAIALLKEWATYQLNAGSNQADFKLMFDAQMTQVITHCIQQQTKPFNELVQLSYLCLKTHIRAHDIQTQQLMTTIEHHLLAEQIDQLDHLFINETSLPTTHRYALKSKGYHYPILILILSAVLMGLFIYQKHHIDQFIHHTIQATPDA